MGRRMKFLFERATLRKRGEKFGIQRELNIS
jgi:hypothetical protein